MATASIRVAVTAAERAQLTRLAASYSCDVPELIYVAVQELLAAHAPRPKRQAPKPTTPARTTIRTAPVTAPTSIMVAPALAATECPPSAPPSKRTYATKPCAACGKDFTPSGPRSKACDRCEASFARDDQRPEPKPMADDLELQPVWNGTMGRQGASISSH
jgi:hypothetical protein